MSLIAVIITILSPAEMREHKQITYYVIRTLFLWDIQKVIKLLIHFQNNKTFFQGHSLLCTPGIYTGKLHSLLLKFENKQAQEPLITDHEPFGCYNCSMRKYLLEVE